MTPKLQVVFLGFAIPSKQFKTLSVNDANHLTQTQSFAWAAIEALQSAHVTVHAISAAPATNFPHNTVIVFRGKPFVEKGIIGQTIGFINLLAFKHVSRYISARSALGKQHYSPSTFILVHGVHSPFLLAALSIAKAKGVPAVTILTDPPSLTSPFDSRASVALKSIDRKIIHALLARFDGVIALSPKLANTLAPRVPTLPMEGIAPPANPECSPRVGLGAPRVVYAGAIRRDNGIAELMGAVAESSGSWELHVYGKGPSEELVRRAAAANPRIYYHGVVPREELAVVYAGADLLVNPRWPDTPRAELSFPSKLLEYMASGTAVLSTHLPSLPSEYLEYITTSRGDSRSLGEAIDALVKDRGRLKMQGARAMDFICSTRGAMAQGRRMSNFLDGLT